MECDSMTRTIATDLDGTLFYPERKLRLLNSKNRKFLKKLVNSDVEIVLVTGRNRSIAEKIEKRIKSKRKLSMIGCSCAFIVHDGELIIENALDKKEIPDLIKEFDKDKNIVSIVLMGNFKGMLIDLIHFPSIFTPFALLGLKMQGAYYEFSRFGRKRINIMLEDPNSKVYKVMPLFGFSENNKKGMQKAKEFAERMRNIIGDYYEFFESGTAVVVAKGTNKAESLRELFQRSNISDDEVIVVGDSGNDIPMLDAFKNSFGMKSAPSYVREHASGNINYVYDLEDYLKTTK
jgi:Cof subfamily protein (haloacid dehalogenase superfamily)